MTTGRTAATESEVLATVDSLGTNFITAVDSTGTAGIDPSAVEILQSIDGIEWVFAVGPAFNATLPSLSFSASGAPITARPIFGELPTEVKTDKGARARQGQAVAGLNAAQSLGLVRGVGTTDIQGEPIPVVGTFDGVGPLSILQDTVLYWTDVKLPIRYIYIRTIPGYDIEAIAELVESILPTENPAGIEVEIARGAIELRSVLSGALGESSRQLMVGVLGVGLVLVAITMTGAVNARKRDFGRQRAIGASRSAIIALVILQAIYAGLLGSITGVIFGVTFTALALGAAPSLSFVTGVLMLCVVVAIFGALYPAMAAARQDPVRILRVP